MPPIGDPSPPGDMHRHLRMPKHRGRKPTTKRADTASPLPTSRSFPHPTGNGSNPRGEFSPPKTFLSGSDEPRYKGKSSTYLQRPSPVNKGGSSPTLRPTGPHKQKLTSPLATLQTRRPPPHIHGETHSLRPHPGEQEATPVHAHGPLAGSTSGLTPGL